MSVNNNHCTTIFEIIREIPEFMFSVAPLFICLPERRCFDLLSNQFYELGEIQKTLLSIYGVYIKITAPQDNAENIITEKSIIHKILLWWSIQRNKFDML